MSKIPSVAEARHELERIPLDLDAFIQLVNDLLPRYVPAGSVDKAAVSVRLARYFQTQGLLDEPFKEGREARYGARHLLQLLAVRRLMANGYSTGSLSNLLRGASDDALQRIIEGEAPRVEAPAVPPAPAPASSNAALDFLSQVRRRGTQAPASAPLLPPPLPAPPPSASWTRAELGSGIEVHLREDFEPPQSPHEWETLVEAFKEAVREAPAPGAKRRRR